MVSGEISVRTPGGYLGPGTGAAPNTYFLGPNIQNCTYDTKHLSKHVCLIAQRISRHVYCARNTNPDMSLVHQNIYPKHMALIPKQISIQILEAATQSHTFVFDPRTFTHTCISTPKHIFKHVCQFPQSHIHTRIPPYTYPYMYFARPHTYPNTSPQPQT